MDSFLQKNIKGVRNQGKKMYSQSVVAGDKATSLQREIEEAGTSLIEKLKKGLKMRDS